MSSSYSGIKTRQADSNGVDRRRALKLGGAALVTLSASGVLPACTDQSAPKSSSAGGASKTDVLIIGAGLSGLYTAGLLESQGVRVMVLEADDRVGGRIRTMDMLAGKPEAGGMQIGPMYARIRSKISDLGLTTYEPNQGFPPMGMYIDGQPVTLAEWADSPLNKTVGMERKLPPFALKGLYLRQAAKLDELDSWLAPEMAAFDIPFDQFLHSKGASDEAMRLMEIIGEQASDVSTLSQMRNARVLKFSMESGSYSFLDGGMSRLPEGMAENIQGDLLQNKKVVAVNQRNDGVEVICGDGSAYRARFAVMTLPFSVLREVVFDPPLQGPQMDAVQNLPYSQVTQIFYDINGSFWEEDGMPASMFTDSPLERIFSLAGPDGDNQHLWAFINGNAEKHLQSMNDKETLDWAWAELKRLRPSVEGRVEPRAVYSWSRNPYARGAYSYFAPGQMSAFGRNMSLPAGRVHFAGEHTAVLQTGMEGAMESGERVVMEILDRLSA